MTYASRVKMGNKKKLSDITFSVTFEMGKQKLTKEWEAEDLYDEDKQTIRPPKKDDGDPPGFYEKLSAKGEYLRQRWEDDKELPLDFSSDIKARIAKNNYWLLQYKNDEILHIDDDAIHRCVRRSLHGIDPPIIKFSVVFKSSTGNIHEYTPQINNNNTIVSSNDSMNMQMIMTPTPNKNVFQGKNNIKLEPPINPSKNLSVSPPVSPSTTVMPSLPTAPRPSGSFINDNSPLKQTINEKGFLKIESIKMRDIDSYFSWHTNFHIHCHMNGVFCPSVKDMSQGNIMGTGWSQLQLGDEIMDKKSEMSNLLWKLLAHEELFPPKEGDLFRDQVLASGGCGYTALYNISQLCHHPALDTDYVTPTIGIQTIGTSFGKHIRSCENYIWGMSLKGDVYDEKRCLDTVLGYLHPKYKAIFKEEARRLQNQKTSFPFDLTMARLGATFIQWSKQHDLDHPGKGIKHVNKISNYTNDTEDSDDDVYAVDNSKIKCPDCGLANHTDDDCNVTVNYVLAKHKINNNPGLEKRILAKHSSKLYKRRPFGGKGPKFGRKPHHNVKAIDDDDEEHFEEEDNIVDDVGCIDLDTGSFSDADFAGVLCVETDLPEDLVDDFVSNTQLN